MFEITSWVGIGQIPFCELWLLSPPPQLKYILWRWIECFTQIGEFYTILETWKVTKRHIFHCSHHELLPKVLYQPDPLQFTAMSVGYDVEEPGAMWCHNPIWICNHKGNTATCFSIQDPIYITLNLK